MPTAGKPAAASAARRRGPTRWAARAGRRAGAGRRTRSSRALQHARRERPRVRLAGARARARRRTDVRQVDEDESRRPARAAWSRAPAGSRAARPPAAAQPPRTSAAVASQACTRSATCCADRLRLARREQGEQARERVVGAGRVGAGWYAAATTRTASTTPSPGTPRARASTATGRTRAATCATHGCATSALARARCLAQLARGRARASSASTSARRRAWTSRRRRSARPSRAARPSCRSGRAGRERERGRRAACSADDTRATFRCSPKRRGRSLQRMTELADVAAALADRTRARMLEELLGGPPLPAGALAVRVGVAPSTVSGHLAKLEAAGLDHDRGQRPPARGAARRPAGRGGARGARAASRGDSARPVGLTQVNGQRGAQRGALVLRPPRGPRRGRARRRPARARRAGRARRRVRVPAAARTATTSRRSASTRPRSTRAGRSCAPCTDWTERRPHVAGALGAALLARCSTRGWAEAPPGRPRAERDVAGPEALAVGRRRSAGATALGRAVVLLAARRGAAARCHRGREISCSTQPNNSTFGNEWRVAALPGARASSSSAIRD